MTQAARATPRVLGPAAAPSRPHDERAAAVLGIALGVAFVTCFVTGVLSHLIQEPPGWFLWTSRPAGLYRMTQSIHVATGLASIPLLLAKLWVVYPKLFEWPPFTNVAHFLERVSLVPLVGGGLFELFTGLANINQWYPWPFNFRTAHFAVAWITIGALIVHIGAKWTTTRSAWSRRDREPPTPAAKRDAFERRRFLAGAFGTSALVTLLTVGQTVRPLERLVLLAPRRPSVGPQGFAVNRSAVEAGVVELAHDPEFCLTVEGKVARPLRLSLDEVRALPQHEATLPIQCVEGWSTSQRWRGVRVRDLLDMAGAGEDAEVRVDSLQQRGAFGSSDLNRWHARDRDTLLALEVGGEPLHTDHGFPIRLIGPNRPGVHQTKWVTRLVVV